MSDKSNDPFQFWQELKRRKVIRVIPVYAAASFVLLELVDIITEPLGLPGWTINLVLVLLSIGFVIAVILSWVYDITPDGVQKTKPVKEVRKAEKTVTSNSWKIATYVSILIIVTLVVFQILNSRDRSIEIQDLAKSIAILPFENLGLEDNKNPLHDAIPIALIMELQNVEGFIIRPRGSTLKYKETNLRSPEIGKELIVNFLLTGYLQQQGTNVLVNIMLIHAASEEVIWQQSFEMEIDNIFQVQRDISKQVASALKNNFIAKEEDITDNPDAYMAFLTGLNYYWKDLSGSDIRLAIRYFGKAVELDSTFIQAYVKLSTANCWMYHLYFDRTPDRLQQARKFIEKAYEIDPGNADINLAEGIYYYAIHDYEKALEKFNLPGGLVFDDFEFNYSFAALYRRQRKLDKAIEYFLKAAEADPQNKLVLIELAETYLLLREYDQAEKYFDQILLMGRSYEINFINEIYLYILWEEGTEKSRQALMEAKSLTGNESCSLLTHHHVLIDLIDGKYEDALNTLTKESFYTIANQFVYNPKSLYFARIYHEQNNIELAIAYWDSARIHLEAKIDVSPQDSRYHSSLGIAYAGLGRKNEAVKAGETAVKLMPIQKDFYRAIFRLEDLARIYTMVGEYDMAIKQIKQLLSMPSFMSVNLLKKDPVWKPLKSHPDFNRLLETYSEN